MQSPLMGRRGIVAAAHTAVISVAMLGLLGTDGAAAGDSRGAAWDSYVKASEAYTNCRLRGRTPAPCRAEKAASQEAEARYRAEIGAVPTTGR